MVLSDEQRDVIEQVAAAQQMYPGDVEARLAMLVNADYRHQRLVIRLARAIKRIWEGFAAVLRTMDVLRYESWLRARYESWLRARWQYALIAANDAEQVRRVRKIQARARRRGRLS